MPPTGRAPWQQDTEAAQESSWAAVTLLAAAGARSVPAGQERRLTCEGVVLQVEPCLSGGGCGIGADGANLSPAVRD